MKITRPIKDEVNRYLDYEFLSEIDIGRELKNLSGGQCVLDISYNLDEGKELDGGGNVVKYYHASKETVGHVPPEKAMTLIATLFPEAVKSEGFIRSHRGEIEDIKKSIVESATFHWSRHAVRNEAMPEYVEGRIGRPQGIRYVRYY